MKLRSPERDSFGDEPFINESFIDKSFFDESDEEKLRVEVKTSPFLKKSLVLSLGAHVVVLAAIYNWGVNNNNVVITSTPTLEISFVNENPQNRNPLVLEEPPEVSIEEQEGVEEVVEELVTEALTDSPPAINQVTELSDQQVTSTNDIAEALAELRRNEENGFSGQNNPVINTATLSKAISDYTVAYQKTLTRNFVDECIRYKNRYGVKECPANGVLEYMPHASEHEVVGELMANINWRAINQIEGKKLIDQANYEYTLTNEEGVVGQLAKESFAVKREILLYMSGKFTQDLFPDNTVRGCVPSPCVFKYTPHVLNRPSREEENQFEVATPLFIPRK